MRPIKYTLLNKPELEYEIKLRLADPADTVVALKRQILGLIESNPDYVVDSPVPLAQDIAETSATLAFLEPKLTQITEGATRLIPKVETYLNHVFHRIERMDLDSDPSLQEDLKNLKPKFENLEKIFLSTLPSTTEQNPEQETDDQHTHEDTQNQRTQEEHTQEQHTHEEHDHDHYVEIFSTPQYSHTQTPAPLNQQLDKSLHELKKFNFSGKTCPRSFIQNIEEFRMSRRIDPHSLMTRIPDIFSDSALHWLRFKLNLNPNFTWKQLCTDLIKDFGGHDFDYKFLESIRNRTQGQSEPIIIYVSIMSGMFNRLSKPLANDEKLEIIMRNIRPCYSNFIAHLNITTLEQLISACQQYEKVIDKNKTFRNRTMTHSQWSSTTNPSDLPHHRLVKTALQTNLTSTRHTIPLNLPTPPSHSNPHTRGKLTPLTEDIVPIFSAFVAESTDTRYRLVLNPASQFASNAA
ncbi:hypothetical protein NE865_04334 [Phthorimaea operculella]|nr:hypothetical protein NE865_04334 [Phthorimaea operculella]